MELDKICSDDFWQYASPESKYPDFPNLKYLQKILNRSLKLKSEVEKLVFTPEEVSSALSKYYIFPENSHFFNESSLWIDKDEKIIRIELCKKHRYKGTEGIRNTSDKMRLFIFFHEITHLVYRDLRNWRIIDYLALRFISEHGDYARDIYSSLYKNAGQGIFPFYFGYINGTNNR